MRCGRIAGVRYLQACLIAALVLSTGCGREDDNVVIVESPDPDFSAGPGQVVITAKTKPSPKAALVPAKATASAPPADGLVPFLPVLAPLATVSGQFQPLVRIELSTGGGKQVEDLVSTDGAGVTQKFLKVKPGPFMMKVTSELLPATPLVERQVTVDGERSENIAVGAVTFSIPKDREEDVMKGIQVTVMQEPGHKVLIKSTLLSMETRGVVGEKHPRTALLPFGKYSYTLADLSTDPTIGFTGLPEGTPPVLTENTFDLTEERPVTLVNLEGLIRTK